MLATFFPFFFLERGVVSGSGVTEGRAVTGGDDVTGVGGTVVAGTAAGGAA